MRKPFGILAVCMSIIFISNFTNCSFNNVESANAAKLVSLSITDCTLSPNFSPDVFTYMAICTLLPRSVQITPVTENVNSKITINGTAVLSGEAFQVHSYDYDNIVITVTSPDNDYSNSYTLSVKEGL